MFKPVLIVLLLIRSAKAQIENQSKISFDSYDLNGGSCLTVINGELVNGMCMTVIQCPSILANILKRKYDHTVCGYEGMTQIVCCPDTKYNNQIHKKGNLNLKKNLECQVTGSNDSGVIKFLSDCPTLNKLDAAIHKNKLCDYEICSDLVCCPVLATSNTRLKNVCSKVDAPDEILKLRLLLNQECTIQELNLKGVYQQDCGFANRNPHLKSILQNVCNDEFVCSDWYCCPIEDIDEFGCTASAISTSLATLVGPKCIDSLTGRQGTCKREYQCRGTNHRKLDLCGLYCCAEFVCCPDIYASVNQPVAERECSSYLKYFSKEEIEVPMNAYFNQTVCHGRSFAAGGIVVSPGDFPHMAALGYESNQQIFWNCGGSLISDQYVLTAAHCLSSRDVGVVKKVRLGVIDLLNDINTGDCPEEFDVAEIVPYPEYNPKFVYNDIGLIKLVGLVKFNFHIRPICLPTSSNLPKSYESMGWGALGAAEDKSVELIKVYQELFSYEECQEQYQYNTNRRLYKGILNDTHICAGSRDSIQSTCAGDSGGPLLARHEIYSELFYIYGVVSFGTACGFANSPGVYTKVFPYVSWIEAIVWS